jgi:hypothetical protein
MAIWISPNTDSGEKVEYQPPPVDDDVAVPFTDEWPDARDGDDGTSESVTLAKDATAGSDGDYLYVDFEYDTSPNYPCSAIRVLWTPGADWEAQVYLGGSLYTTITASGDQTVPIPVTFMNDVKVTIDYVGSTTSNGSVSEVQFKRGQTGQAGMMF